MSDNQPGRTPSPPGVCEVLMHDVLLPEFEKWLNARGLILQRTPFLDSDPELPTYNVAPGPALMRDWSYLDRQTGLTGDDVLPDGRLAYTTETGDGLIPCDYDLDPGCRGCSGTCCTGIGSEPCVCE